MRSCIYCGRELEKGEVCDCPQSVAHRAGKRAMILPKEKTKQKRKNKKSDKKTRENTG